MAIGFDKSVQDSDADLVGNEGYTLLSPVVLVGLPGCGKSAVGKALAAQLGARFVDSDAEIELAANMDISEIFVRFGEDVFRDRETKVLERLLAEGPCILSTGGGAYMAARNRDLIAQAGAMTVWLRATLDVIWERVRHKDTRPLLQTDNPRVVLADLATKREPIYALADMHVQTRLEYSVEQTRDLVTDVLLRSHVITQEPH